MVERATKSPTVPSSSGPRPATGIVILARVSLRQTALCVGAAAGEGGYGGVGVKVGVDSSDIDDVVYRRDEVSN